MGEDKNISTRFHKVAVYEGIISDRDCKIIWDGGSFSVKKGDWLMINETGQLFRCSDPFALGYRKIDADEEPCSKSYLSDILERARGL